MELLNKSGRATYVAAAATSDMAASERGMRIFFFMGGILLPDWRSGFKCGLIKLAYASIFQGDGL